MLSRLVHVETVEVMTAVFMPLEFVCHLNGTLFFKLAGLMKDGVVMSTSMEAVGDLWKEKLLKCMVSRLRCWSCPFSVHKCQ